MIVAGDGTFGTNGSLVIEGSAPKVSILKGDPFEGVITDANLITWAGNMGTWTRVAA